MIGVSANPTPNERALAAFTRERIAPSAGSTVTLAKEPVTATLMVYKNTILVDELDATDGYTVSGKTLTLITPAVLGDVFHVTYWARQGTN